jgi:hypothetical protein
MSNSRRSNASDRNEHEGPPIGNDRVNITSRLGRRYRSIAQEIGPLKAAAVLAGAALLVLLLCLGLACLIGVRKTDAMYESGKVQRAYEAVRHNAGPHMLVRELSIVPGELTIWAMDPDMPPWRFVPSTRQHSSRTVFVPGVYEQSWRVTHWSIFGHDWYWVSGPEPEGIIEQKRGTAFDLKPDEIPDLADLTKAAIHTIAGGVPAEVTSITLDSENTKVWVNSLRGLSKFSLKRNGG